MNSEYWINRWNQNQTGFHLKGVNPLLTQFWPSIAESEEGPGSVLVPLCGKTQDLMWLAEEEHDVFVVEFSRLPANVLSFPTRRSSAAPIQPPSCEMGATSRPV